MDKEKLKKANELLEEIDYLTKFLAPAEWTQSEDVLPRVSYASIGHSYGLLIPEEYFKAIGKMSLDYLKSRIAEKEKELESL